jgi:hypothetical protein
MADKAGRVKGKDLLVRKAPLPLHFRIDKHMEDTGLKKREAVLDLLDKATKNIHLETETAE